LIDAFELVERSRDAPRFNASFMAPAWSEATGATPKLSPRGD